jgi:hypothetical protein
LVTIVNLTAFPKSTAEQLVLLCVAQPFKVWQALNATMLAWLGHEMSILASRGSPIVAGFVFTQITSVNLATTEFDDRNVERVFQVFIWKFNDPNR